MLLLSMSVSCLLHAGIRSVSYLTQAFSFRCPGRYRALSRPVPGLFRLFYIYSILLLALHLNSFPFDSFSGTGCFWVVPGQDPEASEGGVIHGLLLARLFRRGGEQVVGNSPVHDIASRFLMSAAASACLPVADRTSRGPRFLTILQAPAPTSGSDEVGRHRGL
jgi:hypothetical protein